MEKKKAPLDAIIAHPIPEEQQRLAALLERDGVFRVRAMTHDGEVCLRAVMDTKPDLLILDSVLSSLNGLDVLQRVKGLGRAETKCLMLTSHENYVKSYALFLGADFCLLSPFTDSAFVRNAHMLVIPPEAYFSDEVIDAQTAQILREVGVPDRLKAYPYVLHAVRVLFRDPGLLRRREVVRTLYGGIGACYGTTDKLVERAIRTLTSHLFDKGDPEYLSRYFGNLETARMHINNSDFLSALTRLVKERLMAEQPEETGAAAH